MADRAAQRLVAGVDSSTQSCKVVVCDAATGAVVREARAPHPDGTEVSPAHWWHAFLAASGRGLLDDVSALSVGGQQHGLVAMDADGDVVRDALLWNDTRSAPDATDLVVELGGPKAWAERIGLVPVAAITVTKLRWLARAEPASLARTRTVVLPHDWLTGRILGPARQRWTTDRGDASGTGYWSAARAGYDREILRLATSGIDLDLPEILAPLAAAGLTPSGILVGPGSGDNMAAALGLSLAPGEVAVSLGTSGTVFARHGEAVADGTGEVASFADATGGFLPLACTLNAARVLSAGARMLGTDLAGLDRLALAAEWGAGGLTLLPYLAGERTPNLPNATGTLSGLRLGNATPENLARAVVEGMLLNLVGGLDALRREGVAIDRVVLIGGAAASAAVRALAPGLFGVPVLLPTSAEYVGLGAARQAAGVLTGELPDWRRPYGETRDPSPADVAPAGEARERYRAWVAAAVDAG